MKKDLITIIHGKLSSFQETGDITVLVDAYGLLDKLVKETQDNLRKLYTSLDYED